MFKNILVPIDLNQPSSWETALPTAIELCRRDGAKLHVMTVIADIYVGHVAEYFPPGAEDQFLERAAAALHDIVKKQVSEDITVQEIVADGSIYREILSAAEKVGADLIVMASHRPELKDYLIGANAGRVVRYAGCSVMVVRD